VANAAITINCFFMVLSFKSEAFRLKVIGRPCASAVLAFRQIGHAKV
jgi:hypothetical protein